VTNKRNTHTNKGYTKQLLLLIYLRANLTYQRQVTKFTRVRRKRNKTQGSLYNNNKNSIKELKVIIQRREK
jgi:hypothetical protein